MKPTWRPAPASGRPPARRWPPRSTVPRPSDPRPQGPPPARPPPRAVARESAVDAPVRLLHVLEHHVDLVGGGLADLHHRVGDGRDDLALLLVGAAGVPLNRDVGHGSLLWSRRLLEPAEVVGKVRGERVRLDDPVVVEAYREVLADLVARVALSVEPSPRGVAVVQAPLIVRAEHAHEAVAVGLAVHDPSRLGRGEIATERDRDAPGEEDQRDQTEQPSAPRHAADYCIGPRSVQPDAPTGASGGAAATCVLRRAC